MRIRPLAWGDSFGFRQVVTRSRDVTEPAQLAGLKIRTIQSAIYVKAVELMGASPTPMAFGEVYTSLQTGVIDGYEHDASTTLQQRFYEVARYMTRTRHIAGVLGLWSSASTSRGFPPTSARTLEAAALEAARAARARPDRGRRGHREAARARHDDPRPRRAAPRPAAEALWQRRPARWRDAPGSRRFARERAARRSGRRRDAHGSRARAGDRRAPRRRRPRRRPAGRRPARAAPADPVDRGDGAPAARLAHVRRRHRARCSTRSIRA